MVRIAVVGTGIIGMSHLEAIKNTGVCTLCAVCDINDAKVKEIAKHYQVPYFTDYHEIVKQVDVDAVIINLPHYLHCESTIFFLEHGVHVLVEKPMANTTEECQRMISASDKSNRKLAVGHVQRYYKANKFVKEAIETGKYGSLCMINGMRSINYFNDARPKWFLDKALAGGGIGMNYGAHALDTLFYVTGETMPEVTSSYGNAKTRYDIEGHVQFMLRFPDGLSMCETLSGYNLSGHEVVYYFTDGVLKVKDGSELFQITDDGWKMIEIGEDGATMERQLIDFVNYLENKPNMICDGLEGKAVISVLEEMYRK